MGNVDLKANVRRIGAGGVLKALYEAAWKEVFADPAAAIRRYQPTWQWLLAVAPHTSRRLH